MCLVTIFDPKSILPDTRIATFALVTICVECLFLVFSLSTLCVLRSKINCLVRQNIFGSILELENHSFKVIRPELINVSEIYVGDEYYPSKESLEKVDAPNVAAVS